MDKHPPDRACSLDEAAVDALVRSARADVPLTGSFQADVWRRISAEEEASLRSRGRFWLERIFGAFAHPATAGAVVVGLAAIGIWLGSGVEPPAAATKWAYVEAVSPFARTLPHDHVTGEAR